MRSTNILELFTEWDFDYLSYKDKVCSIGDICAIRTNDVGELFRRNYERGMLLLAVAWKYQLCRLLEFGTGRGFVVACVSLLDSIQDIYTIDRARERRTIGVAKKAGFLDSRTHFIQKNSFKLKSVDLQDDFDLVFIDGEHSEKAVKNDFKIALQHTTKKAIIVFDDYRNKHKEVKKYIKLLKYDKLLVSTDGWIYDNIMIATHGDADKVIDNKEMGSGQVILNKK